MSDSASPQNPCPLLDRQILYHWATWETLVCTFLNGWEEIQKVNVFLDVGNFYSLPLSHQSHTELVTRTGYTRPGALGHQPSGLTETPIRTDPNLSRVLCENSLFSKLNSFQPWMHIIIIWKVFLEKAKAALGHPLRWIQTLGGGLTSKVHESLPQWPLNPSSESTWISHR